MATLNRSKKHLTGILIGSTFLSQAAITPFFFASTAFADSTSASNLATEMVDMSGKINDPTSLVNTLASPVVNSIRGLSNSQVNQVLYGTDTVSTAQTNLSQSIQSLLQFNVPTTSAANTIINNVSSQITTLSPSVSQDQAVSFLQDLENNAVSNLTTSVYENKTDSTTVMSNLRTAVQNAASANNLSSVFSNSGGTSSIGGGAAAGGGGAAPVAVSSATSSNTADAFQWLQKGESTGVSSVLDLSNFTQLQSALTQLNAATTDLIIPSSTNATSTQLNQDVLTQLRNKLSTNATLTFGSGDITYDMPLSKIPSSATSVTVTIDKANTTDLASLGHALQNLASQSQAATESTTAGAGTSQQLPVLITTPVSFTVNVQSGNSTNVLEDFGNTYSSRSIAIPANQSFNPQTAAVVMLDNKTNTLLPVPATFVKDATGNYHAVIHRTGNSIYAVISYSKDFSDVQSGWDWAKPSIDQLASRLIISGKSGNTFAPADSITRAEFATMLVRALGLTDKINLLSNQNPIFNDVDSTAWYANAVAVAKQLGLVHGDTNGNFNPNQTINREEMASMIANALKFVNSAENGSANSLQKFSDQSQIDTWAAASAALAVQDGIISGKTSSTFAPKDTTTRAESAVMIARMLQHDGFLDK